MSLLQKAVESKQEWVDDKGSHTPRYKLLGLTAGWRVPALRGPWPRLLSKNPGGTPIQPELLGRASSRGHFSYQHRAHA